MYRKLNDFYGPNKACTSLAQNNKNFQPYQGEIPYINKELFEPPSSSSSFTTLQSLESIQNAQQPRQRTDLNNLMVTTNPTCQTSIPIPLLDKVHFSEFKESKNLLPVLDCRFNLREICKQCILLEDHLTHKEKRCKDCCIKHFLALEGLCEEAISLDKEEEMKKDLSELPQKIREIQQMWYENPISNAHECSQELRQLRKKFMEPTFDVIFNNSCSSGVCRLD